MANMYTALARYQERYAPVGLLPAYCGAGVCCVLVWVISTPLRNVGWAFGAQVWRVACLNGSLCACANTTQCCSIARCESCKALRTYMLSGVPSSRYPCASSKTRKSAMATTDGCCISGGLPLTLRSMSTAHSVACYAKATRAAAAQSRRRAFEGFHVAWIVTKFVISLAFFAPMAAFDLLEFALLGTVGVAVALVTLNVANYVLEWTSYGPPVTVLIVTAGVVTHIWRGCDNQKDADEFSPTGMIILGLKNLRARAAERERSEKESLQQPRGSDAAEDQTTYADARDGVEVTIDEEAPPRAPAAISVEFRAAQERSTLLRLELARLPEVRRGRRTCSRGGCPVPGYTDPMPGIGAADSRVGWSAEMATSYEGYRW
ncbi:hypothetical protein PHYSODRAFT_327425 [Phytophthora sojae]|uniref:Transmembrane protein n=1 Tax=Phytophthora sojae (strain P6497) TaxID=1094619 RepID=G4Z8S9_PHYSP|nr:hypothetical protein PHYSODRAFT_327425 [Phytophthora sojae]EGZ19111.1 hypothetical protein PHYSODRAFT_327425 [Phytophthora sojae]|eukprot:XP_009521828.1 hypothetical protein PHYSODRAFT_327425 [Phytophthora sojae]